MAQKCQSISVLNVSISPEWTRTRFTVKSVEYAGKLFLDLTFIGACCYVCSLVKDLILSVEITFLTIG